MMLADEMSEKDIHDMDWRLIELHDSDVIVRSSKGIDKKLERTTATVISGSGKGERAWFQSAGERGDRVRLILGEAEFEKRRAEQKAWLAKQWQEAGLPGTVMFLHQHSGEMELMLDHEAMRWARSLKTGDSVTLAVTPPIKGVVREVRPWRERTQLRLVAAAADRGDLHVGTRVEMKMPPPPQAVQDAQLPPDIGRRKDRQERIEWFLASIYCTCGVAGNSCTGHFYTLASCNPNSCGVPHFMRAKISKLIAAGRTGEQVLAEGVKNKSPMVLKPHLAA